MPLTPRTRSVASAPPATPSRSARCSQQVVFGEKPAAASRSAQSSQPVVVRCRSTNSSIQRPTSEVLRLIQESPEHSHPIFDRQRLSELGRFADLPFELLAYDSELATQCRFGP